MPLIAELSRPGFFSVATSLEFTESIQKLSNEAEAKQLSSFLNGLTWWKLPCDIGGAIFLLNEELKNPRILKITG